MKILPLLIACLLLLGTNPAARADTNRYSGSLKDTAITVTADFSDVGTVSGFFFRRDDPDHQFSFTGSNAVEGVIEISITDNGSFMGTAKLFKTRTGSQIIWSGIFHFADGTTAPFRFQRAR